MSEHTSAGVGATSDGKGTAAEQLAALDLSEDERLVLAKVADIVRRISYGTVVLVIQDGKVVQIEMAEKFRLR
ncbi:MAG TPA: YezD family protein [Actinomycetota bacterium]